MTQDNTTGASGAAEKLLFDDWKDAIEDRVRAGVRGFIEAMLEEELSDFLARPRYGRRTALEAEAPPVGSRHGHHKRFLTGTFGKTEISAPRAALRRRRQYPRMAQPIAARLPAAHQGGRYFYEIGASRSLRDPRGRDWDFGKVIVDLHFNVGLGAGEAIFGTSIETFAG